MPRIRSTKPEYWSDFDIGQLSRDARLLYVALWNFADEHARLAGDPRFVKGQVFVYDDDLSVDAVGDLLGELADAHKIVRYVAGGAPFIHIPSLARHQRLEAAKVPSRLPAPPDDGGPDGPRGGRADKSARGADSYAPNSAPQPVENPIQGDPSTFAQVNAQPEVRADESAPRADESSLLYVAGSREHGAWLQQQHAAEQLPPIVAILRSKLNTHRLVVRWDKLTADQLTQIEGLVETHGDAPLVKAAIATFQPNNPPVFAQAWLATWLALPAPGEHLRLANTPPCPEPGHNGTTIRCNECAAERLAGGDR